MMSQNTVNFSFAEFYLLPSPSLYFTQIINKQIEFGERKIHGILIHSKKCLYKEEQKIVCRLAVNKAKSSA